MDVLARLYDEIRCAASLVHRQPIIPAAARQQQELIVYDRGLESSRNIAADSSPHHQ
jgi:hypothetical protein